MKRPWLVSLTTMFLGLTVSLPGAIAEEVDPWVDNFQAPQYFAVSVEQVDRSVDWYRSAFGLRILDDTQAEDGRWRIVNLVSDELFVEVIFDKADQKAERARGFAKVGFRVANVDLVAERIEVATGTRPRVLEFKKHGVRLLQLHDPDDNIVQLTSPLSDIQDQPQQ